MKKILIGLLISLAFVSCKDKNAYTINGTVSGPGDGLKFILYSDPQEKTVMDSVEIKGSTFTFSGVAQAIPNMCFLSVQNLDGTPAFGKSLLIVLEPGEINVAITTEGSTVSGTALNDKNKAFDEKMSGLNRPDQISYMQSFIKENANNALGAFYFSVAFPVFESNEMKEILELIPAELKSSERMLEVQKEIVAIEEAKVLGKQFKDIKGLSIDGKEVKLSDFAGKGKIVMVDFWASWCGPCIGDIPQVKKLYDKYKNKGFEIVGVSLDDNHEKWAAMTKKHNLTWPQFSNLKGWEDEAAQTYRIASIPYTLLIDKDGIVVAERLRGEAIAEKLEELLNK